jgi:hypothetical protein
MLAYVFWHRPATTAGYEDALAAFHRTLAGDPPPGLRSSAALRLDAAPWLPGDGPAYEDWYLVDDWTALGALNAHAASGARTPAHDAVAHFAATGSGGVYALIAGPAAPPQGGRTAWLAKPAGHTYEAFHRELERTLAPPAQAWQRQMTLGPAPEYAVVGASVPWPAAERRWSDVVEEKRR